MQYTTSLPVSGYSHTELLTFLNTTPLQCWVFTEAVQLQYLALGYNGTAPPGNVTLSLRDACQAA